MIYGIGTDITKVSRFEKWVKNEEFIKRFFNPQEIMENGSLNAKCEHYAARFAAKEAVYKAISPEKNSNAAFTEVEILSEESGRPYVVLHGELKKIIDSKRIEVSLSHEREFAIAFAIVT